MHERRATDARPSSFYKPHRKKKQHMAAMYTICNRIVMRCVESYRLRLKIR